MLVLEVFCVLLTWAVCAAVLIGLGSLALCPFGQKFLLSDTFWTGLAVTVCILQIWHFFMPVDLLVTLALMGVGIFGIIRHRALLLELVEGVTHCGAWFVVIYIIIVASIGLRAVGPCVHFDTGLYGASALRWILTYRIVPGLANVHHRLGFNSSIFLCIAALGQGVWRDLGHHLFAGLLVSGFWGTAGPHFIRAFRTFAASATDWFYAILLIPCIYWTTHAHLVGTMTDLPATIVCLVAAGVLFEQLDFFADNSHLNVRNNIRTVVAMVLFALGMTMKLSVGMFAVLGWMVGLVLLWTSGSVLRAQWKWFASSIILSSLLVIPWLVRSIILSGYPFYPFPIFGVPVDWKASAYMAGREAAAVRWWARTPFVMLEESQTLPWVGAWFHRNILGRAAFQVPLVLSVLGLFQILITSFRTRLDQLWLWLLVPSLGGLVFWFAAAPAPRFGEAALWTTASVFGTSAVVSVMKFSPNLRTQRLLFIVIVLVSAWCVAPHRLWGYVYQPLLINDKIRALPQANVTQVTTTSGLTIFWRVDGIQCWDAPIPCTPFFEKSLRLRRAGDICSGFKSEGPNNLADWKSTWSECLTNYEVCNSHLTDLKKLDHGGE